MFFMTSNPQLNVALPNTLNGLPARSLVERGLDQEPGIISMKI